MREAASAEVPTNGTCPWLARLDTLLAGAAAAMDAAHGAPDPFRGLYVSAPEVERLLGRDAGVPHLYGPGELPDAADERLDLLAAAYGLSPFERDVLLVALAPELDLRYERLFGYLQDDVTRRRPTVDVALNLLCASREEKLRRRASFGPGGALARNHLIDVVADPQDRPPLLARPLALADYVARWLLGDDALDTMLGAFTSIVAPEAPRLALPDELEAVLPALLEGGPPVRVALHGSRHAPAAHLGRALAHLAGAPLAEIDAERALALGADIPAAARQLGFLSRARGHALLLTGADALRNPTNRAAAAALLEELAAAGGIVMIAGSAPWPEAGHALEELVEIALDEPTIGLRQTWWRAAAGGAGLDVPTDALDELAGRFDLGPSGVEEAVATASGHSRWLHVTGAGRGLDARLLFAAAREHARRDPGLLAVRIESPFCWDDIVLREDTVSQLREICARIRHRHVVLGEWGFGERLAVGRGVQALFSGPSGTGKTMAAGVIANDLELDLYRIDLSQVVDKYVGETEKRLEAVFRAGEDSGAVLFFDEADAVFGKRSETKDAHDRYANIEVAYLLQRIEAYGGIAVLATNFRSNIDQAFLRRLAFAVEFDAPDEALRRELWRKTWPEGAAMADDVDFDLLASRFALPGGYIRNIALAAAYLASSERAPIAMRHVVSATRREYQKLGQVVGDAEFDSVGPAA